MSICINAQMWSYVCTLFEHPSKWYESYQENGTKYLKRRSTLDEGLQQKLNACAGEIFLCGIPADTKAEKIAEVASLLGEVYILRFKVHFSGASRGYAYLQYTDPNLMPLALEKLPLLFRELQLPMVKVCESRNSSKLLLRKTLNMSPLVVFETLKSLISFNKLVGHELFPGYFEYQIIFKCNEEAVHARRELLKSIIKFGPKAVVVWDNSNTKHKGYTIYKSGYQSVNHERFKNKIEFPRQQEQQQQQQQLQNYEVTTFKPNQIETQNIEIQNVFNSFQNIKLY